MAVSDICVATACPVHTHCPIAHCCSRQEAPKALVGEGPGERRRGHLPFLELQMGTVRLMAEQCDRDLPPSSSSSLPQFPPVAFPVTRLPSQNFDFGRLFILALKKTAAAVTFLKDHGGLIKN